MFHLFFYCVRYMIGLLEIKFLPDTSKTVFKIIEANQQKTSLLLPPERKTAVRDYPS